MPRRLLAPSVGTFVNRPNLWRHRNLQVESIEHHFAALSRATARHPVQPVDGTAIYCEWSTHASEWSRLRPFLSAAAAGPWEASARAAP